MSNILTQNPIYVDATGVLFTHESAVHSIVVRCHAANDSVIIKDSKGNVVFDFIGTVAKSEQFLFPEKFHCIGMTVTTCTSGAKAYIYC